MGVVFVLLSLLVLVLFILYLISTWKFNYWKKRNVPHLKPTPLLGNYGDYVLMRRTAPEVAHEICKKFPNEPYVGAYYGTEPALIIRDPELLKLITTKDFAYFNGRENCKYNDFEVTTRNLFFTQGDRWKVVRQNMSPLFTSAKLKIMFYLIEKCAYILEDMLDHETSIDSEVEMRSLVARYTMDCTCSCGFGIDTNTMEKNSEDNPFTKMGNTIFENSTIRALSLAVRAIWPSIFYGLGFKVFPDEISDFFHKLLTGVFNGRQNKPSSRNDFVDMVLNLRKSDYIESESVMNPGKRVTLKIDDELLVAQCVVFFAAGFETSATTLSFTLYELAKDQRAQKLAIEEVDEYLRKHEGKVTHECVSELPYLEACMDETLRLYPVLGLLTREVMETYTLPDGLRLEKGMRIHLPLYHLHRDPDNFPEPEQYLPERFLSDAKANIKPYTYMPFGEGPRICIGMRLAKMQSLPGLVAVLKKYRLELAAGMPRAVELNPKAFATQPLGGLRLKLIPRDGWEKRMFAR